MDDTILRSDYFVYLFRNPLENNKIFYIGMGTGSRDEQLNGRNKGTTAKIEEIRNKGGHTIIERLRVGLDKNAAKKLEGAAIDLIGIQNLTNINHGDGSNRDESNFNEMKTDEIEEIIDPKYEANIAEHAILIRINKLYRYGMDADSLYDATRGVWVIGGRKEGGRRDCAEYAFSVFKGIIMEVYKIKKWYPAGIQATFYKTRPGANEPYTYDPPRWEFVGEPAESEIREKYLKKSVKKYLTANSQNPIKYVNCPG